MAQRRSTTGTCLILAVSLLGFTAFVQPAELGRRGGSRCTSMCLPRDAAADTSSMAEINEFFQERFGNPRFETSRNEFNDQQFRATVKFPGGEETGDWCRGKKPAQLSAMKKAMALRPEPDAAPGLSTSAVVKAFQERFGNKLDWQFLQDPDDEQTVFATVQVPLPDFRIATSVRMVLGEWQKGKKAAERSAMMAALRLSSGEA